jgi:mono/diheme cytochrome c family protein
VKPTRTNSNDDNLARCEVCQMSLHADTRGKRILRYVVFVLGSLIGLALIAYLAIYVASERVIRRTYDVPKVSLSVPTDTASIGEGRRLAIVRGCFDGCHGKEAGGAVMFDEPMIARIVAPNLTLAVRKYNDGELAAIIRNGIRPDGRSIFVMPSEAYVDMTDRDLGMTVAFLRSLPETSGHEPRVSLGPAGRAGLAFGKFKAAAQFIAEGPKPPEASGDEARRGRYLAQTICVECHGMDLHGYVTPEFEAPDLRVVAAYSPQAFTELLRTGTPIGGRELKTMGPWARRHLSYLDDAEIAALYVYLHAMPAAAPK